MTTNRFGALATLLKNGKVLVAGGANGGDPGSTLSSAELYDPATGRWSPTGSMTTPRDGGTATLLGDGRVLVAGGTNEGSGSPGLAYLSSAELYNPASGTWTSTGSMTAPRAGATATLLGVGKVLVAGGTDGGDVSSFLTSAELYNPASGTWTSTGSMTTPRASANASLLKNGKVLVAGGDNGGSPSNSGPTFLSSAELYNPASGTWSSTGAMTTPRSQAAATVLQDGAVLEAGGESADSNDAVVASAEVYDPASGTWSSAGTMTTPRAGATANLLRDGEVLVAGGNSNTGFLSSAELFHGQAQSAYPCGSPKLGHDSHPEAVLVLIDGVPSDGDGGSFYPVPVANPAKGTRVVTNYCPLDDAYHERDAPSLPSGFDHSLRRWSEYSVSGSSGGSSAPESTHACDVTVAATATTTATGPMPTPVPSIPPTPGGFGKGVCPTEAFANAGAVLLPYSYRGASLDGSGILHVNAYTSDDSKQPIYAPRSPTTVSSPCARARVNSSAAASLRASLSSASLASGLAQSRFSRTLRLKRAVSCAT